MKDLLVGQTHVLDTVQISFPQLRYREPPLLARNTGKEFVDVSPESASVSPGLGEPGTRDRRHR